MRRLVLGTTMLAVVLAAAPVARAGPLADARSRERALRAELQQATAELQDTEARLALADDRLAFDRGQLESARRQLSTTRTVMAGQMAAVYRSGGLLVASALLEQDPQAVPDRIELATVLATQQAQTIEDAQVAESAYQGTLGRVTAGYERAKALRDRAREAVRRLEDRLQEAQALEDRLARLERRRLEQQRRPDPPAAPAPAQPAQPAPSGGAGGIACILARPYSYVDSWGAARSGGRSHQGTDVMAPHGAEVYAYTAGVVSRESTSTNGGIQLYLQGNDGAEYFYAHLSRYAVPTGTRVRAGQLIAYNGQTGNAQYTVPHVHFEVHPGGAGSAPVNPYPYVKRACG
jgi:murein DD-endopeptidase MepM/ murein hydrolase activator NlpD